MFELSDLLVRVCGRLMLNSLMGKAVHNLNTDLLGKGQLNSLASGGSQCSQALLKSFRIILDLWDSDTFLFREVLAADSWKGDGLVDAGLDWLGVGDSYLRLNNSHNRDIVASLLGDLLAVVFSISMSMTISILGRLADGHHLSFTLLDKRNLNSLRRSNLTLRLVRVGADLVVDFLCALGTDCARNSVTLFGVNYSFNSKFYRRTNCFQGRGANLSQFNHILYRTVVFWVFIAITWLRIPVWASWTSSDQRNHDKEEDLKHI
jgi:hypothetical protein